MTNLLDEPSVQAVVCNVRDITERRRADEALAQFAALVESSSDAIIGKTLDGVITSWNPAATRLYGYSAAEIRGRSIAIVVPPERAGELAEIRERLQRGERIEHFETTRVRKDGTRIDVSVTISPIRDATGTVSGSSSIARDITEQVRTQAALAAALREYENITETVPDVLYMLDLDGRLIKWNRKWEAVTGLSAAEIAGRSALDFFPEEEQPRVYEAISRVFATGYGEVEAHVLRTDGGRVPYHFTGVPLKNERDTVIGMTGIGRDITERRRAEAALREHEARFRSLIDNAADLTTILDAEGILRYVSPSHQRILGYASEDLVGQNAFALIHPDDAARLWRLFSTAIPNPGDSGAMEFRFRHKDGSWRVLEGIGKNLRDDPAVGGVVVNAWNITDRKRAEEKTAALLQIAKDLSGTTDLNDLLLRVQQRTAELLPCDRVATFCLDPDQQLTRMASHYCLPPELVRDAQMLTFAPGQVTGGLLSRGETLVINDMREQHWLSPDLYTHFQLAALIATPLRVRNRHLGFLLAINSVPGRPFSTDQVDLCIGIAQQLAVAIEAADVFRAQQEEAHVSAALARVGQELILSLGTPAFLDRLCQVTAGVLNCDSSHTLLFRPHEDAYVPVAGYGATAEEAEIAGAIKVPSEMVRNLLARLEEADVTEVGHIPPGLLSLPEQRRVGVPLTLCMALRRGTELIGLQVALSRGRVEPFSRVERRIAQGIAHVSSVALEHARVVEELERANRLKSDFVATMSHELRTPLHIILGYTSLLIEGALGPLTGDQLDVLRRADSNAGTLLELITDTLDMGRLEAGSVVLQLGPVDLPLLIRDIDAEVWELYNQKPTLRFAWSIESPLPPLTTDAMKLKVVVKNVITNAIKFTPEGSVIVRVAPRNGGVEFTVTDTGIGIAANIQPVIFEAFRQADSSATRRYGGVGLGLYITSRFLDMLGGTISVESAAGCGSTFRVWVPSRIGPEQQAIDAFTDAGPERRLG